MLCAEIASVKDDPDPVLTTVEKSGESSPHISTGIGNKLVSRIAKSLRRKKTSQTQSVQNELTTTLRKDTSVRR